LTLSQGITNNGTFEIGTGGSGSLSNTTTLIVSDTSTLVNSVGAFLEIEAGATSTRTFNGNLNNQGTVNMAFAVNGTGTSKDYANSGTFNITSGALNLFSVNSWDSSGAFNGGGGNVTMTGTSSATSTWSNSGLFKMTSGNLSLSTFQTITNSNLIDMTGGGNLSISSFTNFNNSGDIEIPAGQSFTVNGGSFNMIGSSLDGGGTLLFRTGADLILSEAYSPNTSPLTVTGHGSRVGGSGTLTNASTLNVTVGANIDAPFVNNSSMLVQADSGTTTDVVLSNSVTNNGTLRFESRNDNSGLDFPTLTLSQGMINNGRLELGTGGSGSSTNRTTIVVPNGSLLNAAGGEIVFELGGTRISWC